ncbi:MAG: Ig-like domain-containing protein, partial [Deinococcales bacterium]
MELTEDGFLDISLAASDADNDPLSYVIDNMPQKGQLTGEGQLWRYQPDQDVYGEDSFSFSASDGKSRSNSANIRLSIRPVNDAPRGLSLEARKELLSKGSLELDLAALFSDP